MRIGVVARLCHRCSVPPQVGGTAHEVASDHDALDLGGAVDDLEHLRERDEPRERVVVEPPVGAERLAALDRGAQGGVRPEALGVCDRDRATFLAEQLCRLPGQPSRRLEVGGDVGERPGDSLMRVHGLPEDGALARVPHGNVERLGMEAVRDRRDVEAGNVDRAECGGHALAGRDEEMGGGAVELEVRDREEVGRCLAIRLAEAHAGIGCIDHEQRDVTVAGLLLGLRDDEQRARDAAERDPGLRAADDPGVPGLRSARRDRGRVGAGVRLGQVEAAELLARDERLHPALAQGVVTDAGDRRRDGVVHRDRECERRITAAELLEDVTASGKERPRPPSSGATKRPVRPESLTASRG